MSRHLDSSTTTKMAKIMVQYGRPSRSSWAKSFWSSFGRTVKGKAIWEKPIEIRLGEGFQLGMLIRTPWKKVTLVCVCGWHQNGWKEKINPMWKVLNKEVDLGKPTSFFDHVYLGCTQRQCEMSKDIADNYRTMFESRISAGATVKFPYSENFPIYSWSYDMEGYAKKCGMILWVGKQDDSTTLQSIYSMHWWSSFQRRRNKIRGRLVKSVLSNCSEMLIFGTYWKTLFSLVSEQNFHDRSQNGPKLVTKYISFELLHSSHMWIHTVLFVGSTAKQCRLGLFQDLRFCRRSWGFKINFRWNIVRFWKSYVCSNQLDV